MIEKMATSKAWKEETEKRSWTPILLTGGAYSDFLAKDTAKITAVLKDLGLAS